MVRENSPLRETTLAGKTDGAIAQKSLQPCLRVIAVNEYWAFPWVHFLHVRGDYEKITATFTTHKITFEGEGLLVVFNGIAEHRELELKQGSRLSRFELGLLKKESPTDFIISKITIEERG